jgi:hypothetical protein
LEILFGPASLPDPGPNTSSRRRPRQQRRKRARITGPAFDAILSEIDPNWVDITEVDPTFGPRPDQLTRMISRPCYPHDEELSDSNHFFRCIANSMCDLTQKSPDRQLCRVYKHTSRRRVLRHWKLDLFALSESAYANMAPGGLRSTSDNKQQSLNAVSHTNAKLSLSGTTNLPTTSPVLASSNPFAKFDPTTAMTLPKQIDHTIARLICEAACTATLVDYPMWNKLLKLVGPELDYSSPGSSYVRGRLIPTEARRAILHMREHLAEEMNLSLSFDGLTMGEQPVYTVYVCTSDRRTLLYRADVFYGSHNTDYMVDSIEQASIFCAYNVN